MSTPRRRARVTAVDETSTVTTLELFFDLVFVFALTQVTALLAADLTPHGALRGLLILGVLWWCWVGYSWLGNVVRADEGIVRAVMFAAMAAMFVIALTIPEAFDDLPGGLSGPVVFAVGYFVVRALHLGLFWVVGRDDPAFRRQLLRFTPSMIGGTTLLLAAAATDGRTQTALWAAALLADYGGTFLAGASGWRINSPKHFAERHGLILIVALGESIVAIGVGVAQLPISWPIVVAATLGLALAGAMWWAYFDLVAIVGERVLHDAAPAEQPRLARESYSYLHLPMVAGIVLVALGLKKVLEYVGDTEHYGLSKHLSVLPAAALFGGAALYLAALVGFRYRNLRSVNGQRAILAVVLLALVPVATLLPALAALALVAAAMTGLIAFEAIRFAEARDRVRHREEVALSHLRRQADYHADGHPAEHADRPHDGPGPDHASDPGR